jgi:hypothetical protein
LRRTLCEQEIEQNRDQGVGEQVEAEAIERFEAEDPGGDAEQETGY